MYDLDILQTMVLSFGPEEWTIFGLAAIGSLHVLFGVIRILLAPFRLVSNKYKTPVTTSSNPNLDLVRLCERTLGVLSDVQRSSLETIRRIQSESLGAVKEIANSYLSDDEG